MTTNPVCVGERVVHHSTPFIKKLGRWWCPFCGWTVRGEVAGYEQQAAPESDPEETARLKRQRARIAAVMTERDICQQG